MAGVELSRRSDGHRTLVYLDQSTLSDLASGDLPALLETLREGVARDVLVCPTSDAIRQETKLAPGELREALETISDDLSLDVHFIELRLTRWYELDAAACVFLGKEPRQEIWREAFRDNPQAPWDEIFPGSYRIKVRPSTQEWELEEVRHEKSKELLLRDVYERVQTNKRTFEQQAEAEQTAMLRWALGWLFAPQESEAKFQRALLAAADEMQQGGTTAWTPGSAVGSHMAIYGHREENQGFLERHPELRERRAEFWDYLMTGPVPSLRLPALIRAALGVTRGRKPRAGDAYDVNHLTRGLSRCHIVTADSGMATACRERDLIPPGCELFSSRETQQLEARLTKLIAASSD